MKSIRVGSVQMEHQDGDVAANLATVTRFVEEAAAQGVQLVVFPECCLTGYWYLRNLSRDELLAIAEPVPSGPSIRRLLELSRQHTMTIGAGLVEVTPDGTLYNSYVVVMPNGAHVVHRKLHCFISEHLASGDSYTVFDTPQGCRVGVLTCYDNNIGENVRLTTLQGAEILVAPHQTGGCDSPDKHIMGLVDKEKWARRQEDPAAIEAELKGEKGRGWLLRWLPARAHDNGLFYIFSNGVGRDDDEIRTGNAMILDPYGRILAETWAAKETLVVADLDASLQPTSTGRRWLRTRRPELYGPLAVPTGNELDTRISRFNKEGL